MKLGTKLAVALISIPHFLGTGLGLWRLREHVDRRVVLGFGVASAGVLVGTLVGERVLGRIPERIFRTVVALLILALGIYMLTRGL